MSAYAAINDADGDATVDGIEAPQPPQIRASSANNPDRIEGYNFAPGTEVTLTVDTGTGPVPVSDPPTTDAFGNFNYDSDLDLDSGDVVEVSDGIVTRSLTMVGLTFNVLDRDSDTASGTSDQPDGTPVRVNVGNENVTTTVTGGTWTAEFTIDITPDMGGQAAIAEPDGDETIADAPPPPRIRGSLTGEWVDGQGFAPETVLTLSIDTGAGLSPVTDPPTTDASGAFWYQTAEPLRAGHAIRVSDGVITRDLTLVGLTVDEVDLEADTVTGTSDQPDGTPVFVSAGNQTDWEEVVTTVEGESWTAAFTIDITQDPEAAIYDDDGDATVAHTRPPAQIRASAGNYPDRVEGYNFAPDTEVTITVDTGTGPAPVSDPPTTDAFGTFNYDSDPTFDLDPGDIVEVSDGSTTRTLTLVGLTFDTLDVAADTASGSSDQPDGTPVRVNVGNDTDGEDVTTTITTGTWTANFTIDITADTGGQAAIAEPDGDETIADALPQPANPQVLARLRTNQVYGFFWPLETTVTITIDDPDTPESPDYVDSQPTMPGPDFSHVFFDVWQSEFVVEPGHHIVMTDGTTTKELTVTDVYATDVDVAADTMSGYATPYAELTVGPEPVSTGSWRRARADADGSWHVDFSVPDPDSGAGPYDIVPVPGWSSHVWEYDEDGDLTWYDINAPYNHIWAALGGVATSNTHLGDWWIAGRTVTLTIDRASTPLSPDYTASTIVQPFGRFRFLGSAEFAVSDVGFRVEPGDELTMTDGKYTHVLVAQPVTITSIDPDTDHVAGTAPPLADVLVELKTGDAPPNARTVTTGATGLWEADFSTDAEPFEWEPRWFSETSTYDIQPGDVFWAEVADEDGDLTLAQEVTPANQPPVAVAGGPYAVDEGESFTLDGTVIV